MKKIPCSVCVLTRDSAVTLARALESVREFAEVIVCDGGSSDATLEIASRRGARIIRQDPRGLDSDGMIQDFACVRNACLEAASHDWVLYIDSDESASRALTEEIDAFLASAGSERWGGFRIPAGIIADGRLIRYSSNYPGYQIRFFRKSAGKFVKPLHERFAVNPGAPVGTFGSPWHYYVDSRRELADFPKDLARDLAIFRARSIRGAARWIAVARAIKNILAVVLKSLRNYTLYGFSKSYPPRLEALRIRYQWAIIMTLLWRTRSK